MKLQNGAILILGTLDKCGSLPAGAETRDNPRVRKPIDPVEVITGHGPRRDGPNRR